MPVTLKTNSFKYRDDSSEEWSPALVQATASLEPAFQDIGKLASELGIVVNGNTAAVNIAAGQYIILKNSTISGKEDGLYVAANAVSAGTALQSTDIPAAAITNGGLNALNDNLMPDSGNNYCKMPDGTLIQWGNRVTNTTNWIYDPNLPQNFINTNYTVVISNGTTANAPARAYPDTISKFGFSRTNVSNADTFYWIAIGRWK